MKTKSFILSVIIFSLILVFATAVISSSLNSSILPDKGVEVTITPEKQIARLGANIVYKVTLTDLHNDLCLLDPCVATISRPYYYKLAFTSDDSTTGKLGVQEVYISAGNSVSLELNVTSNKIGKHEFYVIATDENMVRSADKGMLGIFTFRLLRK